MKDGSFLQSVRNQYEELPYPFRDPENERTQLLSTRVSSLDSINHYCFAGQKDFSDHFRVLIPGGGTGDCTLYLAEQLRGTNAEIVYLDMTTASMEVAKQRAAIRKLKNITWVHESILNIPQLDLGKFDFITCSGVLHHLANPDEGLAALTSVLHEQGSMAIMVYGTYGRTGVYQMQDLMRRINTGVEDADKEIELTKRTLQAMPQTNWFRFNMKSFGFDLSNDSGIYDLLLHSQDRSYTVPEFYEFFEKQGLKLNTLYEVDHPMGNLIFEPQTFIKDPVLLEKILQLPLNEQQAVTELLFGQYAKQTAYASFSDKQAASFEDQTLIPIRSTVYSERNAAAALEQAFGSQDPVVKINDFLSFQRTPLSNLFFQGIDGQRNLSDIVDWVHQQAGQLSKEQIRKEMTQLYSLLCKVGILFLRTPSPYQHPSIPEMEKRPSL